MNAAELITSIPWKPVPVPDGELEAFRRGHPDCAIIDETSRNLEELFLLRNPKYRFDKQYGPELEAFRKSMLGEKFGAWFHFPWINACVRYFPEELHLELRTGRNKNLVTAEEQKRFYEATVVFLGMSVGSHGAIVTAMTGGAKHMKLADPDILSGDNLNRIRVGFHAVGLPKVVAVARQIYEINPYADLVLFPDGITAENADAILEGAGLVVEEMDHPYWKLRSRELARERRIPVVMATDNGDGVIVDVERYDVEPRLPVLNGLVRGITAETLKAMPPKDLPKVAGKIAGANLVVPRMLESVAEVGKTLYSWPQLGTAANMCGSLIAALGRRIVNGDSTIRSGRYSVNPDAIFESGYRLKWFSRKAAFFRFIMKMRRSS